MEISNITVSENIIEIACSGKVASESLLNLIDKVKIILKDKQEVKNILVDLTGIEGKLSFMEHFTLGEDIAKKLSNYRLAVITNTSTVNKVAENVATKKGARMLMTHKRQEALDWFLKSK